MNKYELLARDEHVWDALYTINNAMAIEPYYGQNELERAIEQDKLESARDTVWSILETRNPELKD